MSKQETFLNTVEYSKAPQADESSYSLASPPKNHKKKCFKIFRRLLLTLLMIGVGFAIISYVQTPLNNIGNDVSHPSMGAIFGDKYGLVSPYFPMERLTNQTSRATISRLQATFNKYLETDCMAQWPNVTNCSEWITDSEFGLRYLLTNSIPTFETEPYCPFAVGEGYCIPDGSTTCSQFYGMTCPAQKGAPADGDVIVPQMFMYRFETNPDPTSSIKPLNIYQNNSVVWVYEHTMNELNYLVKDPPPMGYQTIGAHVTGQQIKGPAEAEGYNVDSVGIPFSCGGHITPPVGLGPLWHFHKASMCYQEDTADITTENEKEKIEATTHSELQAYANDGFPIYGVYDWEGANPTLDECNGHFGEIPGAKGSDGKNKVMYHYHMRDVTYVDGEQFEPYWTGCLGPAKGLCNSTVSQEFDYGANWCGGGCDYEICVQPDTDTTSLDLYLKQFTDDGIAWLTQFTVNPY